MIVVYANDYGVSLCKQYRMTNKSSRVVASHDYGAFPDSEGPMAASTANLLGAVFERMKATCPDKSLAPRWGVSLVWYSDRTAGRRMVLGSNPQNQLLIVAMFGPGPADDADWPPTISRAIEPVSFTDDDGAPAVNVNWVPPDVPRDVPAEEPRSAWTTVLGAGALAAAGIGGFFLAKWAMGPRE